MIIPRQIFTDIKKWLYRKEHIILTGARQVGKTTLLKEIEKELIKKQKEVVLLNIESFLIADDLNKNPENIFNFIKNKNAFVLIDEIQLLNEPSRFMKYIYDFHKDIKLIVTGSANLEFKAKFADSLVGRKKTLYVDPLSLKEIMDYEKLDLDTKDPRKKKKLESLLQKYLLFGGLPAVYLEKDDDIKKEMLKEYVGTYINKDIRSMIKELNISKFNNLIIFLARMIGQLKNNNKLSKSVGLDNKTLTRYLDLLQYSFIFYFIRPYFVNPLTQIVKMQKIFSFDLGVRNAILNNFINLRLRDDAGRLFENFVFLELKRKYENISFFRTTDGAEVDFTYLENGLNIVEVKYKKLDKDKFSSSLLSIIKTLQPKKTEILNLTLNKKMVKNNHKIYFKSWENFIANV